MSGILYELNGNNNINSISSGRQMNWSCFVKFKKLSTTTVVNNIILNNNNKKIFLIKRVR